MTVSTYGQVKGSEVTYSKQKLREHLPSEVSNSATAHCIYAWICMLICMAMHGYVRLCMAVHGCVWLCMAEYGCVWLCMAVYGCVWLCMAVYG